MTEQVKKEIIQAYAYGKTPQLASRIFCPKAVKSSIGIIVHLNNIVSFRFDLRNNLIIPVFSVRLYRFFFFATWLQACILRAIEI